MGFANVLASEIRKRLPKGIAVYAESASRIRFETKFNGRVFFSHEKIGEPESSRPLDEVANEIAEAVVDDAIEQSLWGGDADRHRHAELLAFRQEM